MCERAELVEKGLRNPFAVEEGGQARVRRLVPFVFALGGDGGADLGEGGCEVVRGVDEGGACVVDGDADKLDASPIFSEGSKKGEILVGLLGVFLVASEVRAKAHLEENEGAVLLVEGVGGWVGWHFLCVDDVGGGSRSCRH